VSTASRFAGTGLQAPHFSTSQASVDDDKDFYEDEHEDMMKILIAQREALT